jgi:hypothetical protein
MGPIDDVMFEFDVSPARFMIGGKDDAKII